MKPPATITKITGHVASIAQAAELRYLDEPSSGAAFYESRAAALLNHLITAALCLRANGQLTPLTPKQMRELIGKKRRRFTGESGR